MAAHPSPRPRVRTVVVPDPGPAPATMPWWVATIGGALLSAAAGWVILTAPSIVAVLIVTQVPVGETMRFGTRLWLLCHGARIVVGGVPVTLVPLTLTAVIGLALHGCAAFAARLALMRATATATVRRTVVLRVVAVLAGTYGAIVAIVSAASRAGFSLRATGGAVLLAAGFGFFGARRAAGWDPTRRWPAWARPVPRALVVVVAVVVAGGAVAFVGALLTYRGSVAMMAGQLSPGVSGTIFLTLLQFAYVLNGVLWGASWTVGAGFTLGDGSIVSLAGTHVGMLPSIPLLAATPEGVGSWTNLFWLAFPLTAGALAALIVLRSRPRARFDETAIVGGLAGLAGGVAVALLTLLARGDLGTTRLTGLGPRPAAMLVLSACVIGLSGLATGLIVGLLRHPRGPFVIDRPTMRQTWATRDEEETVVLDGARKPETTEPVVPGDDSAPAGDDDGHDGNEDR